MPSADRRGAAPMLGRELERNRIDLYGVSKVHWVEQGHFTTCDGHTVVYLGGKQVQRGVALWIHKRAAGALTIKQLMKPCIRSLPFEAPKPAIVYFFVTQVDRCNDLLTGTPKHLLAIL